MVINRNPEYFLTIAQERSLSRAAEKLYLSQSSLSQYLAKLENALGVRLFDRSKTPIQLTEAGRIYQRYLESNNFLYNKLESELNSSRMQTVKLGAGTWRGSILLPAILPDFILQHPHTGIILSEFPVSELFALVSNATVDFAVMNTFPGSGERADLVQEIIAYERILLVVNRTTPIAERFAAQQAQGLPIDLTELQSERFISLNRNLSVGRHVNNFLERNRLTFLERLYTTNNSTALNLVSKGLGFCFLVETGLEDMYTRPNLTAFDLRAQDLIIPLSIVYKLNNYLSPPVQDAMELVRQHYLDLLEKNAHKRLSLDHDGSIPQTGP